MGQKVLTGRVNLELQRESKNKATATKSVGITHKKSIVLNSYDGEIKVITGNRLYGDRYYCTAKNERNIFTKG